MADKPPDKPKPNWKSIRGKRKGGKSARKLKVCDPNHPTEKVYKPFEINYERYQ